MRECPSFETMSDEVLEVEVRSLSARAAAAMCWFLLAVAEYDRRQAFEAWDCHDMASWLVWKCGICPVTAREHVRVARSLTQFELVRRRFSEGRLSYSQVRAITRAATTESEEMLVGLAEVSTAAQLEKITRAYRRSTRAADDDENARNQRRYLRWHFDDDGNLVGTFCLPAETGAAIAAAIDARVERDRVADADVEASRDPYSAVRADVLAELVAAGAGVPDGEGQQPDYVVSVIVDEAALTNHRDGECAGDGGDHRSGDRCHLADGPGLADQTVRRIACNSPTVRVVESDGGAVLDVGRRTRRIGRRLRHALDQRDHGCRFPGCSRRGVQAHHITHWADGGPTRLDNLVSLCWRHHRRVHEAGYHITLQADGTVHVVHPDGRTLTPTVAAADPDHAVTAWLPPDPYLPDWDGTRLDLATTIDCLIQTAAA